MTDSLDTHAPDTDHDGWACVADIEDIIVRIRAAHDAGITIDDLHARLRTVIEGSDTGSLLGLVIPIEIVEGALTPC